ncbi:MAG: hypothetical protein Kow0054_15870 [Deferrisoma sp.]
MIGISRDSLASHARFREKHGFTFPLLSDPDHAFHEACGAWGEKKTYGKVTLGAIRTTVVVGPDGRVERVYPKVKAKGHAERVLQDLKGG